MFIGAYWGWLLAVVPVWVEAIDLPPADRPPVLAQAAAAAPSWSEQDIQSAVISLERTPCFGYCPTYKLTITGSGKVTYEGYDFVNVKGTQTAQISSAAVQQLLTQIHQIHYFDLADRYEGGPTDFPSALISVTIGDRQKQIYHYMGSPNAPQALTHLENQIDAIVNSKQWVGEP